MSKYCCFISYPTDLLSDVLHFELYNNYNYFLIITKRFLAQLRMTTKLLLRCQLHKIMVQMAIDN